MVFDFGDRRERNLHDLAIGAFDLDARSRQCLCGLHTANDAPNAIAVNRDDFDIVLAVERLEGRESFGYFHSVFILFGVHRSRALNCSKRFEILRLSRADVHSPHCDNRSGAAIGALVVR